MTVILRERATPRHIEFYGVFLTFVPSAGTYWITPTDFVSALGVNVEYGAELYTQIAKHCSSPNFENVPEYTPPISVLPGYERRESPHISVRDASEVAEEYAVHIHVDPDRREVLVALLKALHVQATMLPLHAHTLAPESQRLRAIFDKHPHWEEVLRLRNQGCTEGEISKRLSIKATTVRSALLSLEKKGFEVLKGDLLAKQRDLEGRATHIPEVAPIQVDGKCLKIVQKD
jgi:DNA-binding CsgD family transcriptional regulator